VCQLFWIGELSFQGGVFQIFGLDFVVDEKGGLWLLEVNSSPSMEHSTPITTKLCEDVLEDLAKVKSPIDTQISCELPYYGI
jgi:hypothetical protein